MGDAAGSGPPTSDRYQERPGCQCADCLEEDEVYRFNCPDCPDDLDGHHIAGENRAKSINANHKHEASTVEVVWRA